jgi:hypothetical protein
MALISGAGESKNRDSYEAGKEAVENALSRANISTCDQILLYVNVGYKIENVIKGIRSVVGDVDIVGCTSEGIITNQGYNEEIYGLGVMVFKSNDVEFRNGIVNKIGNDCYRAGFDIGNGIKEYCNSSSLLLLFPDSLTVNMKELIDGIQSVVGNNVPFVGGLSADNMKMIKELNCQISNGVYKDSVAYLLIGGNIQKEIHVTHGCIPLGSEKLVTRSIKNRIYTIDGKPSFDVFKEYTNDVITDLTFDLVVHMCYGEKLNNELAEMYDNYIVRTPLTHDKKDGSVTIPWEIKEGKKIVLMRRDPDTIINNILQKKELFNVNNKGISAILHFNCAGRGKVLFGRKVCDEYNATKSLFPEEVPWLGFYGYGEIAPIGSVNNFHNYTSVIVALN